MILAAGFCTRFFPITEYFPKGLLPVGGKAILSYVLDDVIKDNRINEIALVTNHRYHDIFSVWLSSNYRQHTFNIIDNGVYSPEKRLGAVGDLAFALKKLRWHDDILVLASDTIASLSISKFIDFYHHHDGPVNAVFDTRDPEMIKNKLGCVKLAGERITEFIEKPANPASSLTSIPFYIYPSKVLAMLPQFLKSDNPKDAPGSLMAWLINKVPCYAYTVHGEYYDVGKITTYNMLAAQPLRV